MIIATIMIMTIIIIIIIIAPVMITTIIMVTMELRSASASSPSRTKINVMIKYQNHDRHNHHHYHYHCPSHAHHHTSFTTIMIIIHRNHNHLQQSPFQDAHHLEVEFHVNSCASTLLRASLLLISVKILYFNHHHDHHCHDQCNCLHHQLACSFIKHSNDLNLLLLLLLNGFLPNYYRLLVIRNPCKKCSLEMKLLSMLLFSAVE